MAILWQADFTLQPEAPNPFRVLYKTGYEAPAWHADDGGLVRSGGIGKEYEFDWNHSPAALNLLLIQDGWSLPTAMLRGKRMKWLMRAREFYLPHYASIFALVQSNDPRGNAGRGTFKNINSIQVANPICQQLRSMPRAQARSVQGNGGDVPLNTDWTEVEVPFTGNPADYCYMPPAPGHEGSYEAEAVASAPVDGGLINLMIVAALWPNSTGNSLSKGSGYPVGPLPNSGSSYDEGCLEFKRITLED